MEEALLSAPAGWEVAMDELQEALQREVGRAPQIALQVPIGPVSCAERTRDTRHYLRPSADPSLDPAAYEQCSVLRAQLSIELKLVSMRRGWLWLDAEPLLQQHYMALYHAVRTTTSEGVSRKSLYVGDHLHPKVPMVPLAWNVLLAASLVQPMSAGA